MYAVGRSHPLRDQARQLLREAAAEGHRLFTSAEVLQELLHAYLPVSREATLTRALTLATECADVVPLEEDDVLLGASLHAQHPGLGARDLAHLAVCVRRGAIALHTFDRALEAAFSDAS